LAGDLLMMLRKQDVHAATVFPGQPGIAKLLSEVFLTEPRDRTFAGAAGTPSVRPSNGGSATRRLRGPGPTRGRRPSVTSESRKDPYRSLPSGTHPGRRSSTRT
jgi:hypothetical protein